MKTLFLVIVTLVMSSSVLAFDAKSLGSALKETKNSTANASREVVVYGGQDISRVAMQSKHAPLAASANSLDFSA